MTVILKNKEGGDGIEITCDSVYLYHDKGTYALFKGYSHSEEIRSGSIDEILVIY